MEDALQFLKDNGVEVTEGINEGEKFVSFSMENKYIDVYLKRKNIFTEGDIWKICHSLFDANGKKPLAPLMATVRSSALGGQVQIDPVVLKWN